MIAKVKKVSIALTSVALAVVMLAGCASFPATNQSASKISSSNTGSSEKLSSSSLTSTSSTDSKISVNTSENNWVYYINSKESDIKNGTISRLFRIHSDDSGAAQVADVETDSFVISGNWIYYRDYNGGGIYKIHDDGTAKSKISSITGGLLGVYDNYLYLDYASKSDPAITDAQGYIYRMKSDGTGLQKICSDKVTLNFQISDGYIFYANGIDNSTLYRIRPDGTEKKKLTSDTTGATFSIANHAIYYIKHGKDNFESPGSIYKMNLDGAGKTALGLNDELNVKVSDGMIYYENELGKFFKANLNCTGKTAIDSKGWEAIKVFGHDY